VEAKQALDPRLSEAAGEDLFHCRRADGLFYHAVGVPFAMTDEKLVTTLTQQPDDPDEPVWRCIPVAVHDKGQWGKKTMVVKALFPPYQNTIRIKYGTTVYPIHLVQQKRRLDLLERAEEKDKEEAKVAGKTFTKGKGKGKSAWGRNNADNEAADNDQPDNDPEGKRARIHSDADDEDNAAPAAGMDTTTTNDPPVIDIMTKEFQDLIDEGDVKLPKPVPKVTGRRAAWNKAAAGNHSSAAAAATENDAFQEIAQKLEQQRQDLQDAAKCTEEEQEAALKLFKDQVGAETRNLLGQIAGLQQMIIDNDTAQTRRAERAEERAAARAKKMDAKINKLLAAMANNSAATPCPQSEDDESEDDKSVAPTTDTDKLSATAERKRTRSPVARTSTAAAASTTKKD
jgi:hypothetical protein